MSKKTKNSSVTKKKNGIDGFLILTLIATMIVFLKGMNSDILYFDDNEYFSNYPEILKISVESISKYFSNYYVLMYQPLPVLSFALSYSVFKFDPAAHHTINLLIHLFNIFLVYKFVGLLNNNRFIQRSVAFLFALHPLAVEPVMWISCRSSGMYVCFYLLGLISYMNYKRSGELKTLFICGLWFILSLFSKAHAVTFPLALLVIDIFHFKNGITKKFIFEKIPFLVLSIVFGVAALLNSETSENIAYTSANYSWIDYIFILSYESAWYLFKLIVPLNLSPIYVYPVKTDGMLPYLYYISLLVMTGLIVLIYKTYKTRPYILFGLAFFYLLIAVTFQIVPSRLFIVADRYGYLPNIGVFYIMACWFWDWKEGKINWLNNFRDKQWVFYIAGFGIMFLSFQQTSVWQNDLSLSDRIIDVNPETTYIGRAYGIRGNYKKNIIGKPEEALSDYKKASELDTNDMVSRYQMALTYQSIGDTASAVLYYRAAIKVDPTSPIPYTDLGAMYSNQNNYPKALECANSALKVSKNFPNALVLKAVCILNLGNALEAEKILSLCITTNPTFAEAYKNRGIIKINNLNNKEGACIDFKKALELGDASCTQILNDYCN